ncbi:uncharacterized protein LOC26535055 isoform X1 [Drosophila yakuba]|uniref:Uncharacterized protein, isoform C n=1 Tax=Drosophila yakuba TaxID=7245 RepID=A0A0R1DMU8_DROYA|nr:uncharacterized protein LOC26535055 isoform X1 [Drosophila yakuba]KRJ98679.1 uncharacterized protein Dyak_GE27874, isoform C [Drosophila yakuba]
MSTCEVLPTAKMTDDHFMNPCILIRRLQSGLFWPGQKTMPMRPKRVGILHPAWLQGSLRMGMPVVRRPVRVDNDGSALGLARESFLSVPFMSQSNYLNSWRKGQRVW